MKIKPVCCFSGHRKLPEGKTEVMRSLIYKYADALAERGFKHFYTGGATGFDELAAQTVIDLKSKYPDIQLHMCLPYRYTDGGTERKYAYIEYADTVEYSSEVYVTGCMHDRNRKMVDNSGAIICYLTDEKSGTGYTVRYARQKGLRTKNLADEIE